MDKETVAPKGNKADGCSIALLILVALIACFGGFVYFAKPSWRNDPIPNEIGYPFLVIFAAMILFGPIFGGAWHNSDPSIKPENDVEGMGCSEEFIFPWGIAAIGLMGWAWWRWEFPIWVGVPLTLLILFVLGIGISLLYQGLIRLFSWWRRRK